MYAGAITAPLLALTLAAITVVEPSGNGIGGDAFALVWMNQKLHGINASSTAPAALSAEAVRAQGHDQVPEYGWLPVSNDPICAVLLPCMRSWSHGTAAEKVATDLCCTLGGLK